MGDVSTDDIAGYTEYLRGQGASENDIQGYTKYLADQHGVLHPSDLQAQGNDIQAGYPTQASEVNPGISNPMFPSHAPLIIPKRQNPEAVQAMKEGILKQATFNYADTDKNLMQKYPGASALGQVMGSIPSQFALSGAMAKAGSYLPAGVQALSEAAQNGEGFTGFLGRLGIAGVQSGSQGVANGLIAKPEQGETRLGNAGKQGAAAAILGAGIQAVSEAPGAIQGAVDDFRNSEAFKALNPSKDKLTKTIVQSGQAPQVGQTVLDKGIVSFPSSKSDIATKANEAVEDVGKQLENKIQQIAQYHDQIAGIQTGKELSNPLVAQSQIGLKRSAIADSLENELVKETEGVPTLSKKYSSIQKWINDFRDGGDEYIPIQRAQKLKTLIGGEVNWNRLPQDDVPTEEIFNRALYHTVKNGIEDAADHASQTLGPDFANEYRALKQQYGDLSKAAAIANKATVGEYTNRFISPSDYGMAMFSGLASHGSIPGAAAVGALANKTARTFGNQIAASAANKISQGISDAGPIMKQIGENAPELANIIYRNTPSNQKTGAGQ